MNGNKLNFNKPAGRPCIVECATEGCCFWHRTPEERNKESFRGLKYSNKEDVIDFFLCAYG